MATSDSVWKFVTQHSFLTPTHCWMSARAHTCAKLTATSITPTTVENPHSSPQTQTCLILRVWVRFSQYCFVEKTIIIIIIINVEGPWCWTLSLSIGNFHYGFCPIHLQNHQNHHHLWNIFILIILILLIVEMSSTVVIVEIF